MININRLNQSNEYALGTPNIQVKRSTLKMRETIQSTGMVGKIIPLTVHEVLPSETTRATTQINMEFTPFITNIIHEINGEISNWFVPYRIIWDKWEEFITGCNEEEDIFDGSRNPPLPKIEADKLLHQIRKNYIHLNQLDDTTRNERIDLEATKANEIFKDTLKRIGVEITIEVGNQKSAYKSMIYTAIDREGIKEDYTIIPPASFDTTREYIKEIAKAYNVGIMYLARESLWDYYGLPCQINIIGMLIKSWRENPNEIVKYRNSSDVLISFRKGQLAGYYTEEIDEENKIVSLNFMAYNRIYNDWERLLDWEPKRDKNDLSCAYGKYAWDIFTRARRYQLRGAMPTVPVNLTGAITATFKTSVTDGKTGLKASGDWTNGATPQQYNSNGNTGIQDPNSYGKLSIDTENLNVNGTSTTLEGGGSWNILDMLTPSGLLNYYMANAKIKPRYANQLLARWGINIQDERFQYAQYLGGNNITITQNGVTQTAPQIGDSTTQGNITGQAWGEGGANIDFYAPEHGVIIQLLTIKPSNAYEMGLDCQYTKETRFDYPTPELVDTPDVQIKKSELAPYEPEDAVLGYKAIYDEYRTKFNKVTGLLRPSLYGSLAFKTLARQFDTVNMEKLIRIEDRPFDRIKQFTEQPDFIFIKETNFANSIPLPYINDPRIFI